MTEMFSRILPSVSTAFSRSYIDPAPEKWMQTRSKAPHPTTQVEYLSLIIEIQIFNLHLLLRQRLLPDPRCPTG